MRKFILFYEEGCPQCDFVLRCFKRENVLDNIKAFNTTSNEYKAFNVLYNIKKVPILFIMEDDKLLLSKILNNVSDINWAINKIFLG